MQALSLQSILIDSSRLSQPDHNGLDTFQTTRRNKMYQLQKKLYNLKNNIKQWNHFTLGNIFQAQGAFSQEMVKLQ